MKLDIIYCNVEFDYREILLPSHAGRTHLHRAGRLRLRLRYGGNHTAQNV